MTRRIVYGISLWLSLGAFACTIAALALPNWIGYTSPTSTDPIRVTYGLHKRCTSITHTCTPFPSNQDCHGDDRYFCSMWRSTGFLMNFAVVLELAVCIAYITVLAGGRGAREKGWKVLCVLLGCVAGAQMVAMTLVAYLYEHDNRFFVGWALDKSWVLCTVSWIVLALNASGVLAAAFVMTPEDDYQMIPEPQ